MACGDPTNFPDTVWDKYAGTFTVDKEKMFEQESPLKDFQESMINQLMGDWMSVLKDSPIPQFNWRGVDLPEINPPKVSALDNIVPGGTMEDGGHIANAPIVPKTNIGDLCVGGGAASPMDNLMVYDGAGWQSLDTYAAVEAADINYAADHHFTGALIVEKEGQELDVCDELVTLRREVEELKDLVATLTGKKTSPWEEAVEQATTSMAEQIRHEIDKELLNDILKLSNEIDQQQNHLAYERAMKILG